MPGPIIQKPTLPEWMDPANASVFDAPGQGLLRKAVGWMGLNDPNQVMGVAGTPLETGPNTGGLLRLVRKLGTAPDPAVAEPMTGAIDALKQKAMSPPATMTPVASDLETRAKQLFLDRGHTDSVVGMAQAYKDAGGRGTKLPKNNQAAMRLIRRLMGEASATSRMDPTSPFATPPEE